MSKTRTDKVIITSVLCGVLAVGIFGNAEQRLQKTITTVKPQILFVTKSTSTPSSLVWPNGQSAIGAQGYGVLATNGDQTAVPTASIAKLITALVVLKSKPITAGTQGQTLTLGKTDVDYYNYYKSVGGSVSAVTNGEQITEYQVLQAMLLPSANNLADSLANWSFGSLNDYATAANQFLTTNNLSNTHVGTDASGFSPTTTSTANDLVKLGELATDNPTISEIVNQSTATIPVAGLVKNVNWLLGTAGINGLKTGNSDEAGGNYLFSSNYAIAPGHEIKIIGAVLKMPSLSQAMNSSVPLIVSAQKSFSLVNVVHGGQIVGSYQVPWASKVTASATKDVNTLAWQGSILDKPKIALDDLKAPEQKGAIVGKISTSKAGESTNVRLDSSVAKPTIWWRLTHY